MYCHFNEVQDPEIIGLDPILVSMLDKARTIANIPFVITSGLRTPEHNKAVGGKENSAHLIGLGADIQCNNSYNRFKIVKALILIGFKRIEIAKGHIHVDIDDSKEQEVIFLG